MEGMEAGPLATLADAALSPNKRIHGFLDGMYRLYAKQPNPIGCALGHAAADSDGVSAVMKRRMRSKPSSESPAFLTRHSGIWETPLGWRT
jgi:hypothetical protein